LTTAGCRLASSQSAVEQACRREYNDPRSAISSKDMQLPDYLGRRNTQSGTGDDEETPWRWSTPRIEADAGSSFRRVEDVRQLQSAVCCREVRWLRTVSSNDMRSTSIVPVSYEDSELLALEASSCVILVFRGRGQSKDSMPPLSLLDLHAKSSHGFLPVLDPRLCSILGK